MITVKEILKRSTTEIQSAASTKFLKYIRENYPDWEKHGNEIQELVTQQIMAYGKELIKLEDLDLNYPLEFKDSITGQKALSNHVTNNPGNFIYQATFSYNDLNFLSVKLRFWYAPWNIAMKFGVDVIEVSNFKRSS